jgi:hypothetical protein
VTVASLEGGAGVAGVAAGVLLVLGLLLLLGGVMTWTGRWRRWYTSGLPARGRLPPTAYWLPAVPYLSVGAGVLFAAVGASPYLPRAALAAMLLLALPCFLLVAGLFAFVAARDVEAFIRERPAGTRVSRLVIVPWVHRFLAARFSPVDGGPG